MAHDRIPVILYDFWLDPEVKAVPPLKALLQPTPDEWGEARDVRNDKHTRDDDATRVETVED